MLYHSLMKSTPDAELTVFCDSELFAELFGYYPRLNCRVLPGIWERGVKRARFDLYAEMCGKPFVYLDSDVIVLEDLSSLFTGDTIAGCRDTLEECPFVESRQFPWPGDPKLQNRRYCNDGVLFLPASMRRFLESIRDLARDDAWWERYIIPGRLYANHFFCAMLNRFDVEYRPLDPHSFGWSGLFSGGNWKATRSGNHLVHQPTGKMLYLTIFAHGHDPDYCYSRMPSWLAAFLQEKGGVRTPISRARNTFASPMRSAMRWIESENGALLNLVQDSATRRVLGACAREIDAIMADPARVDRGNGSVFQYPGEFQELLYANNEPANARWKGFRCNGAYLAPLEYEFVEECIRRYGIKSVVESGAGETSAMFRATGCAVVSVEWQEGPWADRARASGADVHIVSFDSFRNQYAEDQLRLALEGVSCDLLFVDSPVGTKWSSRLPEQFLEFLDPRFILVHDASRDHRNIFEWMRDNRWILAEYHPSRSGILLLERPTAARTSEPIQINGTAATVALEPESQSSAPVPRPEEIGETPFGWEMAVLGMLGPFRASGRYLVPVVLVNRSNRDLGSSARISLSYHWRRVDDWLDVVVFDGERSEIHPDLRPGESRRILCEIRAPGEPGQYLIEWDMVEEDVTWFSSAAEMGLMREVEVLSAAEIVPRLK
jgi:hypothetical protein